MMSPIAAYTAPVLLGTMVPTKAARASGSPEGGSWAAAALVGAASAAARAAAKDGIPGGLWDVSR